ncbi:MAG: hypothetical protein NG712_03000, partial [Omnitrophica bacterium]|nr:hypothetical protein [Candidatus Omnitrophota bacterium]
MRVKLVNLFLIPGLISLLAGCATIKGKGSAGSELEENFTATTLAASAKARFSDLPVPVGFKLIQDKSFIFQTEDTRVALLKYSGRAKVQDLLEFYKEQM